MTEDSRCCGSGTCLINAAGKCWCGQQWDGENLCSPASDKNQLTEKLSAQRAEQPGTDKPPRSAADA